MAALAGTAALTLLAAGCGTAGADGHGSAARPDSASTVRSTPDGEFRAALTTADGRRVQFRLAERQGLQERHRAGATGAWSGWQTVYRTRTDRCQDLEIRSRHDTVAVVANFGTYCYDGEPPAETVAGVGTGDLTTWQVSMVRRFDGWTRTAFADGGNRVTFSAGHGAERATLDWRKGRGFGGPVIPVPKRFRIPAYYLGDWVSRDGTRRLRIEEPAANAGKADFSTVTGKTCTATAHAAPSGPDQVDLTGGRLVTGSRSDTCPPDVPYLDLERGPGGTLLLRVPDGRTLLTYVRGSG